MASRQRKEAKGLRPTYKVYVDEAGDEGFKFLENERGSSRWFVLSATIVRTVNDGRLVECAKSIRALLNKPDNHALHFRNLRHEQRIPFSRMIGELPIRTIHIMVHKPSIGDPENFQRQPYSLYRYATRLLIERISWLCRDQRRDAPNYLAELIFSNRSAMSYDDLKDYLGRLLAIEQNVQIDWGAFDMRLVRAVNHDQLAGLQLADAVASGAFYAVHKSVYGETEDRYLHLTRRVLYRHNRNLGGYGIKFWCSEDAEKQRVLAICRD